VMSSSLFRPASQDKVNQGALIFVRDHRAMERHSAFSCAAMPIAL
jgi:hypothetical protein